MMNSSLIFLIVAIIILVFNSSALAISAVWVNEGGDKVCKEELRVGVPNGRNVVNHIWNGSKVSIKAAKNEVVSFNIVLEAATQASTGVNVVFTTLSGPGGSTIQSTPAIGNGVFSWVNRPIELFYVRYLQIKGLSLLGYENYYDERHVPQRLRRPWTGNGSATGTWQDRPDHDKYYPDIAVPLELAPSFSISAGTNQSIWVDVYIPKSATAGLYTGSVSITETGSALRTLPVELTVYNFILPDTPSAKTMLYYSSENVNERYLGQTWITGANEAKAKVIQDRHFLMAHRHKISLIGDGSAINSDYTTADAPGALFAARLKGDFFTSANGYDGPGVNVGNNVYSVMTYGIPALWQSDTAIQRHANGWVNWFETNAPGTEYFLYLIDESTNYTQTQLWANWLANNSGSGKRLKSMATIALPSAAAHVPSLTIPTSAAGIGITSAWESLSRQYSSGPVKRFFLYNGTRPAAGCFMTEDDGVALRVNGWIQFKKHINRWFYWESTYYNDFQGKTGKFDPFQSAHTFGTFSSTSTIQGQTGWNYSNGDGVLFYPGTDLSFPTSSYGVDGPFASLRLKYWRRGIQDHDYLTLAFKVDSTAVAGIVNSVIPKVVWEVGVDDVADPTYVHSNISWSTDPDVWETARDSLAKIILRSSSIVNSPQVHSFKDRMRIVADNGKCIMVSIPGNSGMFTNIAIVDIMGKTVAVDRQQGTLVKVNVDHLSKGIYFIKTDNEVEKFGRY